VGAAWASINGRCLGKGPTLVVWTWETGGNQAFSKQNLYLEIHAVMKLADLTKFSQTEWLDFGEFYSNLSKPNQLVRIDNVGDFSPAISQLSLWSINNIGDLSETALSHLYSLKKVCWQAWWDFITFVNFAKCVASP